MSDLAEKLEPQRTTDGRPRRTLDSLRKAGVLGYRGPEKAPRLVAICPMDTLTLWERVSADLYECVASQRVEGRWQHISEVNLPGDGDAARIWRELQGGE